MLDVDELKIKLKRTDATGEVLAIVTIEDKTLSLRGFMVMKSKFRNRSGEFLRVLPPTYGPKHQMAVYFYDKEFWYKIEDKILSAYKNAESKPDSSFTEKDEKIVDELLKDSDSI